MRPSALAALSAALALVMTCAPRAHSQDQQAELVAAFQGAQEVDLATSKASSVVTLREEIKIPPPSDVVLVKTFERKSLPQVLRPMFARPQVSGVTIRGRFIAIIRTPIHDWYQDVLSHELVHAYISLASPKPLPFWFQEGSAVYFSMGKTRKYYGQPSGQTGVTIGQVVELDPVYKQKLDSFLYLAKKAGDKDFRKWFREAVTTGNVDTSRLMGWSSGSGAVAPVRKPIPAWMIGIASAVVVGVLIAGFYASRREDSY